MNACIFTVGAVSVLPRTIYGKRSRCEHGLWLGKRASGAANFVPYYTFQTRKWYLRVHEQAQLSHLSRYDVCITSYDPRLLYWVKTMRIAIYKTCSMLIGYTIMRRKARAGSQSMTSPLFIVKRSYVQTSQISLMICARNEFCP